MSLIRLPSISWRACHAKFAHLLVRSSEIDILALVPLACCTGLFLRFLHVIISRAFVLRLTSFTIMGRGLSCVADAASPLVAAASSDGSGWGGGLPRRWATSMSSSTNLGLTFMWSLHNSRTFSSTVPEVSSGRPNILIDPLRPCCWRSSNLIFCASSSWVRQLMVWSLFAISFGDEHWGPSAAGWTVVGGQTGVLGPAEVAGWLVHLWTLQPI